MKHKPMPAKELFKLQPGDQFRVYWAKDDNINDLRLNYDLLTVETNDGTSILTEDCYDWHTGEMHDLENNMLDTTRGYAYLYYK